MLIAGSTSSEHGAAELRAYNIHSVGLAESIDGYGTIGSGAPYGELFLHGLLPEPQKTSVKDAIGRVCHAIKGVEIMDPNVGGETRVCALQIDQGKLSVTRQPEAKLPRGAKDRMEGVLKKMSTRHAEDRKVMQPTEPRHERTISTRHAQSERTPSSQSGMLEAMIKRLYIRRFPQTDTVASSGATDQKATGGAGKRSRHRPAKKGLAN